MGKLFTIFYILIGLGVIAAFLSTFAASGIEILMKQRDAGARTDIRRRIRRRAATDMNQAEDEPAIDDRTGTT